MTLDAEGHILVTPSNGGQTLTLTNPGVEAPLAATNEATTAVLTAYDCATSYPVEK